MNINSRPTLNLAELLTTTEFLCDKELLSLQRRLHKIKRRILIDIEKDVDSEKMKSHEGKNLYPEERIPEFFN